jgi:hypothetical protein
LRGGRRSGGDDREYNEDRDLACATSDSSVHALRIARVDCDRQSINLLQVIKSPLSSRSHESVTRVRSWQHARVRGVVLAVVAVVLAGGAVTLYLLASRPPPTANVVAHDAAIFARAMIDDARAPTTDSSSRSERESALQALRRSGPADEGWNAQAGTVFDAIKPTAAVSDVGCYVVGCGATLTFSSETAYRAGLAQVQALAAFRAWTGGKQITSPDVQADGRVVVALLLYRPD